MTNENEDEFAVPSDEQLARFVLFSAWIRSDQTIRQDAFIPHPKSLDVSVTRHDRLSEQEIWDVGEAIAARQSKTLHGRADLNVVSVKQNSLDIRPDPVPNNPNHACIVNWPTDKAAQKSIAQQLAAAATLRKKST